MLARSTRILRPAVTASRLALPSVRYNSSAPTDATRGPINPFPSVRPSPSEAAPQQSGIVPAEREAERVLQERKVQEEHERSGLTTSAPSVEIVAADVLNDAPCESISWYYELSEGLKSEERRGEDRCGGIWSGEWM
jgi:hypothetical protein